MHFQSAVGVYVGILYNDGATIGCIDLPTILYMLHIWQQYKTMLVE